MQTMLDIHYTNENMLVSSRASSLPIADILWSPQGVTHGQIQSTKISNGKFQE